MKKKTPTISIKRENIKGKYYYVLRERGKFRDRLKYKRSIKKESLIRIYKQNKTLRKNVTRTKLTGKKWAAKRGYYIEEVTDYSRRSKNYSYDQYQYIVYGTLANGQVIVGRSNKEDITFPKSEMVKEARRRFFSNLSSQLSEEIYNEDKGLGLAIQLKENDAIKIKEGFVYYARFGASKTNAAEAA